MFVKYHHCELYLSSPKKLDFKGKRTNIVNTVFFDARYVKLIVKI
jgi:hypothetical protein